MNKFLAVALIGIALLVLALVLSFIAMQGVPEKKKFESSYSLEPGKPKSIDLWVITGAFSRNVTLDIRSSCKYLALKIVSNGRVVLQKLVSNETKVRNLERFVAPKLVLESNESCSVEILVSFVYMEAKHAWLSVPALLAMVVGAALLLIGGSMYTAQKIRFTRSVQQLP